MKNKTCTVLSQYQHRNWSYLISCQNTKLDIICELN